MQHASTPFTILEDGDRVAVHFKQPNFCGYVIINSLLPFAGFGGMYLAQAAGFDDLIAHIPVIIALGIALGLPVLRGPQIASVVFEPEAVVFTGWSGDLLHAFQSERRFPLDGVFFERVPAPFWSTYEMPGGPYADLRFQETSGVVHRVPLTWKEPKIRRLVRTLTELRARQYARA